VGIGTPAPAEKLDVAGSIKSRGLNGIVFLRPGEGEDPNDDRQRIQDAINGLAASNGGIIYLMPHPTDPVGHPFQIGDAPDTYHDKPYGLRLSRSGVKLRGYGGKLSDKDGVAEAVTKLKWIGSNDGIVVVMAPTVPNQWVGNLELSDLTIDGGPGGAATGLELNRVAASRFENLSVWNAEVGINMTTDATAASVDTCFNHFDNCLLKDVSQGLVLDGNGDPDNPSDCTQNLFENLTIVFRGLSPDDAGISLKHCDANAFHRVSIFRGGSEGCGVVIQDPKDGAQANYFYHLASDGGVLVKNANKGAHTEGKNVIFGYALGAKQPPPQTEPDSVAAESVLAWVNARGVTHGFGKQTIFGRAPFNAGGTVTVSAGSSTVTGHDSTFLYDVEVDDKIKITTSYDDEIKTVTGIASDTELAVDSAFAGNAATPTGMEVRPYLFRLKDSGGNTRIFVPDSGDVSLAGSLSAQGDINAAGAADLASLEVGGTEVISSQRELHDVAADAGIITTGAFQPARLPLASSATRGAVTMSTATSSVACATDDARLADQRTPLPHASSHGSGGSDAVTLAESQVTGLVDDLAAKVAGSSGVAKIAAGVATLDGGYKWVNGGLSSITSVVVSLKVNAQCPAEAVCAYWTTGGWFVINSSDASSSKDVAWVAIGT
jgi:hypothetical protein